MFPVNLISRFKSFPAYVDMRLVEDEFEARLNKYFDLENCWLDQREREIIWSFFKDEKTLQKIGDEQFISRERVRQIIAKAVEKLDYINSKFKWFYDDDNILNELINEKEVKIKHLTQKLNELKNISYYIDSLRFNENTTLGEIRSFLEENENTPLTLEIYDLDLSVRTINCLKRARIETVYELTQKTEEDLLKIRCLGKKCVLQIKEELDKLNLKLKGEE